MSTWTPDSQEGQLLAMESLAINDCCELAVSVYNAFSPQTGQGVGLSRMVVLNGITRQPGSYSTVDLTNRRPGRDRHRKRRGPGRGRTALGLARIRDHPDLR